MNLYRASKNLSIRLAVALAGIGTTLSPVLVTSAPEPKLLQIQLVTTNAHVTVTPAADGATLEPAAVFASLNTQLQTAFRATRLFRLPDDRSGAQTPDWLLEVGVDDFVDSHASQTFKDGSIGHKRRIFLGGSLRVSSRTTGETYLSERIRSEQTEAYILPAGIGPAESTAPRLRPSDVLAEFAGEAVRRLEDTFDPMTVQWVDGKVVGLNRSGGSGLHPGEIFKAYGPSREISDAATGTTIRRPGSFLARVKLDRVNEGMWLGEILDAPGAVPAGSRLARQQNGR